MLAENIKSMKILITCHYFLPHVGGIEFVVKNIAEEFIKKGHEVRVLTSGDHDIPLEDYDGILVERVKCINIFETKLGIPYPFVRPFGFYSSLSKHIAWADVVISHGHLFMSSFLSVLLCSRMKKPHILFQHNTFIQYSSRLLRFIQTTADRIIGKYVINNSKILFAGSYQTKKYLESITGRSLDVVVTYYGVDSKKFRPLEQNLKEKVKKEMNIPNEKIIALTIRRLSHKNGLDLLVEAASYLKDLPILFLIGGSGPMKVKLEEKIASLSLSNVCLLGFVPDEILPKYYEIADFFVLPSREGEGMPLTVLESFSSGLPVVATKSGGHVELIDENAKGALTEPSPLSLSEGIRSFLKEVDFNNSKVICRDLVNQKFSWNVITDMILEKMSER